MADSTPVTARAMKDILALVNSVVNALVTRTIGAGNGLTGGGDLSTSRTLDVGAGTGISVSADAVGLDTSNARNVDHSAVSVTAGAGLTGGGTIESTRTLNVGAGSGITVNADDIALTLPTASGSYTPTSAGVSNFDNATIFDAIYSRVGDIVTVSGRVDVDATTAGTAVQFRLSVPIATTMTSQQDCSGVVTCFNNGDSGGIFQASNRPTFNYVPSTNGSQILFYTYQYRIR